MQQRDDGQGHITLLLKRLSAGDASAEDALADAVYQQMRVTARVIIGNGGNHLSLPPTCLVNGVLLELVRIRSVDWTDRNHFFRTASRLMRRRFVDYIRARRAQKRPQAESASAIEDLLIAREERFDEILDVHNALVELEAMDKDLAAIVELVYFGGLPVRTVAGVMRISPKSVTRNLNLAQRWLKIRFSCPLTLAESASSSER